MWTKFNTRKCTISDCKWLKITWGRTPKLPFQQSHYIIFRDEGAHAKSFDPKLHPLRSNPGTTTVIGRRATLSPTCVTTLWFPRTTTVARSFLYNVEYILRCIQITLIQWNAKCIKLVFKKILFINLGYNVDTHTCMI